MPADSTIKITYDNWAAGEYSEYVHSSPANSFHGSNMMPYSNGLIGPRPGMRDITPGTMPDGPIRLLATSPVASRGGILICGNQCYYFDLYNPSTSPTSFGDPLNGNNDYPIFYAQQGVLTYITIPGDRSYVLDLQNATVNDLTTDSPGGSSIALYGDRMVVSGDYNDTVNRRRIFYSDPLEYDSWPAENFFDVGDAWQITAIQVQRQALTIYKREGIFVLTGVPGVNAVLRPITRTEGPLWAWQTAIDQNDMSIFLPVFRNNPATFDGNAPPQIGYYKEIVNNLDTAPGVVLPVQTGVISSKGDLTPSSTTIAQGTENTLSINHNGIWTRHDTGVDISGVLAQDQSQVILSNGQDKIYAMQLGLNRPPYTSDNTCSPGDGSTTPLVASISFPNWWTEFNSIKMAASNDQDARVAAVIVDFIKWDTGVSDTNHFEIHTEAFGTQDDDGRHTSDTYTFDEMASLATSGFVGTPGRWVQSWGEDDSRYGAGFQLFINQIRGVHFKKIVVLVELMSSTPRT